MSPNAETISDAPARSTEQQPDAETQRKLVGLIWANSITLIGIPTAVPSVSGHRPFS
jgi:hypothetical protein